MRLGWTEILLVVLLILILFGAKRLPDLARSVGKSLSEFKKGMKDVTDELKVEEDKDKEAK